MSDLKFRAGVHCADEDEDDFDREGLDAALAGGYDVVYEGCEDEGWGEHSYNAVIHLADGRYIQAQCGGCSCRGSGSWSFCKDLEEAKLYVPEQERPDGW